MGPTPGGQAKSEQPESATSRTLIIEWTTDVCPTGRTPAQEANEKETLSPKLPTGQA